MNANVVIAATAVAAAAASYIIYRYFWPHTPKGLEHLPEVPIGKSFSTFINTKEEFDVKYWRSRNHLPHDGRRMYLFHLGIISMVEVASPEAAKLVFDQSLFVKVLGFKNWLGLPSFGEYLFGTNIATSNDPEWSKHRTVVRPAFSRPLRTLPFITSASKLIRTLHFLPDHTSVDIYSWMQRLTLDVLGRAIFSFDFESLNDPQDVGKYVRAYNEMMARISNPLTAIFSILAYLPTKWNKESWKLCKDFKGLLVRIIEERLVLKREGKVKEEKEMDLLDMMIAAADETSKDFSMNDVVYNLGVFFVAGHDTTANVLAAAIYLLAKNKDVQQKLREEIYSILGKPATREEAITSGPEQSQLGRLPYLNAVLKETIRLYPSATTAGLRRALKDVTIKYRDINGIERVEVLPKGSNAVVDIYGMHHDPEYFPDPHKFNPDRWLTDKDSEGVKPWMPFGGGPRICLGMQFSLVEQRVSIAMLLRNFEFELKNEDQKLKLDSLGLLRPVDLRISLKPIV